MTDGSDLGRASPHRDHIMTQFEQIPTGRLLRRVVSPTPFEAPGEIDGRMVSPTR